MSNRALLFTQPGCISCELMKIFLEAKEIPFDERDISTDRDARSEMTEQLSSNETPTLVLFVDGSPEVVVGFDPARVDELLKSSSSSDPAVGS